MRRRLTALAGVPFIGESWVTFKAMLRRNTGHGRGVHAAFDDELGQLEARFKRGEPMEAVGKMMAEKAAKGGHARARL